MRRLRLLSQTQLEPASYWRLSGDEQRRVCAAICLGVGVRRLITLLVVVVIAVAVVVILRGKNCHFNVHLINRIYCAEAE